MVELIPAIDLLDGKCVRLVQGEYSQVEHFSDHPAGAARRWKAAGAKRLHIVDLDGARHGRPVNVEVIREICQAVDLPVQVGGGIRTVEDVSLIRQTGVDRVILGTAACRNPELVRRAAEDWGSEHVWVSIDAREGFVALSGWLEKTQVRATQVAKQMEQLGAGGLIYTDISRDGMLSGADLTGLRLMTGATNLPMIIAGGVSSLEDIRKLADPQWTTLAGVIIGMALYTGALKFEEALAVLGA